MSDTTHQTVAEAGQVAYDIPDPQRVEESSPNRCQYSSIMQCSYHKAEGQNYCKYHLPMMNANFRKVQKVKKYRLTQMFMRVEEFASNPELKNLNEEIAVLNATLENLMGQCHTPFDMIMNQTRLENLVEKIAKVTLMNLRIQEKIGKALDEVTLSYLMDVVSKAITDEALTDEQLIRISKKIGDGISKSKEMASQKANEKDFKLE